MSYYTASPFKPSPRALISGRAQYLLGSFDDRVSDTVAWVQSNSASGTTATLTVQITAGKIPVVGQLITVIGCANSANFNVTNVALTAVTAVNSPDNGVYQLQYTITSTSQATTTDVGQAIMPQQEIGVVVQQAASEPAAAPFSTADYLGHVLTAVVSFPVVSGLSATVTLQGADIDRDAAYEDIATVASVASGTITGGNYNSSAMAYKFYRFNIESVGGLSAQTIVAKLVL